LGHSAIPFVNIKVTVSARPTLVKLPVELSGSFSRIQSPENAE